MRSLLQRVCTSLREYDSVQANLSTVLHTSYPKIPHDVLDAFLHDPSAVISKTQQTHGWKDVDDIHRRVQQQQETLRAFRCSLLDSGSITPPHKVFEDPVSSLMQSLDRLAAQREYLVRKAEDVSTILKRVKGIHADVKKEYNDTLAHTSLVYPEVRHNPFQSRLMSADRTISFLKSPPWMRTSETAINKFGTLVWTPSHLSLIPSRHSGGTTARSSARMSKTSSSFRCTVTNSLASRNDTPSNSSRVAHLATGLALPSFPSSVFRSLFFRCALPGL